MADTVVHPAAATAIAEAHAAPAPAQVRGRPLAVYLVIFGFAVALPALLFSAYLLYRFEEIERAAAARVTQDTAASIRDIVDRELAAMVTTLRVLSTSGFLRASEFAAFHDRAEAALAGTGNFVILVGDDYRQRLNTRVPFGTALGPISDTASVDEALKNGVPYVSDLFFGNVAGQYVFNVALPIRLEDGSRSVLIMTRNAASLEPVLRQLKLEEGWSGTLIDRRGMVIASSGGEVVGAPASFLAGRSIDDLALMPVTFDTKGGETVIATRRSFDSGWRATAAVSAAVIEAPLWNSVLLLSLAGLALLVLTALLAVLFGRVVSRPLLRLAGQARALGHGEAVAELASPVREVNEVSRTLVAAAGERRSAEDRIRFLMRELSHRAKNQLAVVVAMARRTAENSEDMAGFERVFSERLLALARSTDLLVNQNWRGVSLAELVEAHLGPFIAGDSARLKAKGPRIEIGPDAAQSIGLALHELATNASKYGALSVPEGKVAIAWGFTATGPRRLRLEWTESGGPEVGEPARTGFGSVVIRRTVAQSLNAEVVHEFRKGGVYWAIELPAEAVRGSD